MFMVSDVKLTIADPPGAPDPPTVEVPKGSAVIFPAGSRQVTNAGDKEAKIIFVEPFPTCTPCGDIADFVGCHEANPEDYKAASISYMMRSS